MATNKEININGVMTPVTEFKHSAQEIDDALESTVKFDSAQSLTDEQKNQARKNIGAATVDHDHSGKAIQPTSIELFPGASAGHGGYIDFHYNNNSADFTSRIMEIPSGYVTLNGMGIMTRANITAVFNAAVNFKNGVAEYSNSAIKANCVCFAQFRASSVSSTFQNTALSVSNPTDGKLTIIAKNGATFNSNLNILILNL